MYYLKCMKNQNDTTATIKPQINVHRAQNVQNSKPWGLQHVIFHQGNIPSRESIHVYYQRQMCRPASAESSLDRTEEVYTDFSPEQSHLPQEDNTMEGLESDLSTDNLSW